MMILLPIQVFDPCLAIDVSYGRTSLKKRCKRTLHNSKRTFRLRASAQRFPRISSIYPCLLFPLFAQQVVDKLTVALDSSSYQSYRRSSGYYEMPA